MPTAPQEPPAEVALIVVLSPTTVAHVGQLAQAGWDGPVLAVGSVEEARALLDSSTNSAAHTASASASPRAAAEEEGRHPAYPPFAPAKAPLSPAPDPPARPSGLLLDPDRRRVVHDGRERTLTPLEFGVLEVLMQRPGQVQRFAELTRLVWGTTFTGDSAHLHAVVRRLRRKLEAVRAPVELVAVRGIGFRLSAVAVVDDPRPGSTKTRTETRTGTRTETRKGTRTGTRTTEARSEARTASPAVSLDEAQRAGDRPRLEAVAVP